jgi:hypothetical protein
VYERGCVCYVDGTDQLFKISKMLEWPFPRLDPTKSSERTRDVSANCLFMLAINLQSSTLLAI